MGGGGEEVFCSRSMRKAASSANMRLHTSTNGRCPIVELGLCRQRLTSQRLNYPSGQSQHYPLSIGYPLQPCRISRPYTWSPHCASPSRSGVPKATPQCCPWYVAAVVVFSSPVLSRGRHAFSFPPPNLAGPA